MTVAAWVAVVVGSVLAFVAAASADIGIVNVSPTRLHPGDRVEVTAAGYLGMTHQLFTVVLVPAGKAPQPHSCMNGSAICTPAFLPARLRQPPFTSVGKIRSWRHVGPRGVRQGRAVLRFRLPNLADGGYKLGLFCPSCTRGPKGSLIINDDLILRVARHAAGVPCEQAGLWPRTADAAWTGRVLAASGFRGPAARAARS